MKRIAFSLLLVCFAFTGCKSLFNTSEARNSGGGNFTANGNAADLVTHLNKYSAPVQSLESDKLDITVTQNGQPFGLDGKLAFQKGRNFRMVASAIGSTEADLGSNEQEFWFYMKRNDPPDLFFCSYNDLPGAQIKLPLQPDWIAEALCVQELNPAEYEMFQTKSGVELRKRITSNGEQLIKGILVANSGPNAGRVVMHRLVRPNNQEIWRAEISEYQLQKDVGNYAIPYMVKITCPEHKVMVELKIKNAKVNQLQAGPQLFQRPAGYRAHDIARLQQSGVPNQTITRTRGGE